MVWLEAVLGFVLRALASGAPTYKVFCGKKLGVWDVVVGKALNRGGSWPGVRRGRRGRGFVVWVGEVLWFGWFRGVDRMGWDVV